MQGKSCLSRAICSEHPCKDAAVEIKMMHVEQETMSRLLSISSFNMLYKIQVSISFLSMPSNALGRNIGGNRFQSWLQWRRKQVCVCENTRTVDAMGTGSWAV